MTGQESHVRRTLGLQVETGDPEEDRRSIGEDIGKKEVSERDSET